MSIPVLLSERQISLLPRLPLPPAIRECLGQLPKLLRQFAHPLRLRVQRVLRALNGFGGHPVDERTRHADPRMQQRLVRFLA
jgi:hypothetical protein